MGLIDIVYYRGDLASYIKDGGIRNVFYSDSTSTGSIAFTHKLLAHNDHFPKDIFYHLPESSRLSAVLCIKQQAA